MQRQEPGPTFPTRAGNGAHTGFNPWKPRAPKVPAAWLRSVSGGRARAGAKVSLKCSVGLCEPKVLSDLHMQGKPNQPGAQDPDLATWLPGRQLRVATKQPPQGQKESLSEGPTPSVPPVQDSVTWIPKFQSFL